MNAALKPNSARRKRNSEIKLPAMPIEPPIFTSDDLRLVLIMVVEWDDSVVCMMKLYEIFQDVRSVGELLPLPVGERTGGSLQLA